LCYRRGHAGLCCSVAAARHGIKVVLIHDRSDTVGITPQMYAFQKY